MNIPSLKNIENNSRTFFYIFIASCVALCVAIAVVLQSTTTNLKAKTAEIQSVNSDLDLIADRVTENQRLEKTLTDLSDVSVSIKKVLPVEKNQDILLAEIYSLARKNSITLENVGFVGDSKSPSSTSQTEEIKDAKDIRVYPFSASIKCTDFSRVLTLLEDLEKNRRKAQISSLNVNPVIQQPGASTAPGACSGASKVDVNLKIEVYLKNEAKSPTTPAKI
jgi:Tfp pilus assembly protein PilO